MPSEFILSSAFSRPVESLVAHLQINTTQGIAPQTRVGLLKKCGWNVLPVAKPPTLAEQLYIQLSNPLVVLLLLTTGMTIVTGEWLDAILIGGIVVSMAVFSVILERRSEHSLSLLKEMQQPTTTVLVEGKLRRLPSQEVVIGDVIVLHEGDVVPADARVIEADELALNEASLTGESTLVSKQIQPLAETAVLADQTNMVFSGTVVAEGKGKAVVVATGKLSEMGKIASYLEKTQVTPTPLQTELKIVSQTLFAATLISGVVATLVLLFRGETLLNALLTTTALAVSFVPEGLTAVMTVTLALAVQEMVRQKVIIKRLLAAEGLGAVTSIATDKTGTITEGRMKVSQIYVDDHLFRVDDPKLRKHQGYQRLLNVLRFCNNNKGSTEEALVNFLETHGYSFEMEERHEEYRFSSNTKRMSVVYPHRGQFFLFSKGAPDILIPLCVSQLGKPDKKFTDAHQRQALAQAEELASQGFRVLALAERELGSKSTRKRDRKTDEQKLTFLGLIALIDPLRSTVVETVAGMKAAGIAPIMITGDHPAIAQYIAEQAGIIAPSKTQADQSSRVLTGADLDQLLPQVHQSHIRERILATQVFARVRPDHKVQLVELWQQSGRRTAMAGDGVNDAAALKRADVGIAMSNAVGLTKEVADVVITGSYDALLRAVAVGRTVKLRTQLYLHYLLSGNMAEVGLFIVALFMNLPLPMTPIILLVLNLFTDILPAMSMAVEPEDPTAIRRPPSGSMHVFSPKVIRGIVIQAVVAVVVLSLIFIYLLPLGTEVARTAVFTTYVWKEVFRGFTARSFRRAVWQYGPFSNWLMNWALLAVIVGWGVIAYVVPSIFGLVVLPLECVIPLIVVSLIMPIVEELTKSLNRLYDERHSIGEDAQPSAA